MVIASGSNTQKLLFQVKMNSQKFILSDLLYSVLCRKEVCQETATDSFEFLQVFCRAFSQFQKIKFIIHKVALLIISFPRKRQGCSNEFYSGTANARQLHSSELTCGHLLLTIIS